MSTIAREKIGRLIQAELDRFVQRHPNSKQQATTRRSLLGGVPMPWMVRWPGAFPLVVDHAQGARFTDIDGLEYVDFCLGDTGAMIGHGAKDIADALQTQACKGITTMLPSQDAAWVGDELAQRFGLPVWQMAMTATDANRFVLRFARHLTQRPKVLVFDWCYHGTVDEAFATLDEAGNVVARPGTVGAPVALDQTTMVVQFNDIEAVRVALASGEVAAVLAEPAMTNIGIVLPDPGFHEALRAACDETGTLLIIDETHTICTGPGGATQAWGLRPDFFVIGKTIGGGMPAAAYGMTQRIADLLVPESHDGVLESHTVDTSGVGGTLTGNALALAAVRQTLSTRLTFEEFAATIPLATSWTQGVQSVIDEHELGWCVQRLGCRAEYWFCPPPRNGRLAAQAVDSELDAYMHLYALNREILMTPFHNMALMSPFHTQDDVDRHSDVFASAVASLMA